MLPLAKLLLAVSQPCPVSQQELQLASVMLAFGQPSNIHRRDALKLAVSVGSATSLSNRPLPALAIDNLPTIRRAAPEGGQVMPTEKSLQDYIVLLLRVEEACSQETRLIKTGLYKDAQRLNIKRGVRFMLYNYDVTGNGQKALDLAGIRGGQRQAGLNYVFAAGDSLQAIIDYFGAEMRLNKLTEAQRDLTLNGFSKCQDSIGSLMSIMPQEVVEAAREQIKKENSLNAKEYKNPDGTPMLNPNPWDNAFLDPAPIPDASMSGSAPVVVDNPPTEPAETEKPRTVPQSSIDIGNLPKFVEKEKVLDLPGNEFRSPRD